jgi:hypothetical protein
MRKIDHLEKLKNRHGNSETTKEAGLCPSFPVMLYRALLRAKPKWSLSGTHQLGI